MQIFDPETNKIKYASFSSDGNFSYFRERETLNSLYHVLLNFEEGTYKRVRWQKSDMFEKLEIDGFNNNDLGLFKNTIWSNSINAHKFNRNIFGKKLWHPY